MESNNNFYKISKNVFFKLLYNTLPGGNSIAYLMDELQRSRTSIDTKIQQVNESLQESSRVIQELEVELKERTQNLKYLQVEYERYSELAKVAEGESAAIMKQIELSVDKGKIKERWVGFAINIIAGILMFVLGIILGPIFNKWFGINQ